MESGEWAAEACVWGFRTVELKWNYLDFGSEDRAQTGLLISLKQLV